MASGTNSEFEHLEFYRNVHAIERHRLDIGFQLPKQPVMRLVGEGRSLEVCRQADMKDVWSFFRRTKRLRIGRAERHQAGFESLPDLGVGVGLFQLHSRQCRDSLQIRQWRHVHDRQARQLRLGNPDHQNPERVVGVLRLLHRKADQVVTRQVDVSGRGRI